MLLEMLKYRRPEGSRTQRKFCNRFLKPVFGNPDRHGNYVKTIGDKPRVAFMSHHDTVHSTEGKQHLKMTTDGIVTVHPKSGSNCLGADCTTGIYIMLQMMEAKVEGTYVVHAAEEIGCKGSSALVDDNPGWLEHTDIAISFDRKGSTSVITHQMGARTCSDEFGNSLIDQLDMYHKLDNGGSYTDSNEYRHIIPECTNLSVGYYNQHTKSEAQDTDYLVQLIEALKKVDWSKLTVARDPSINEYDDKYWWGTNGKPYYSGYDTYRPGTSFSDEMDVYALVTTYPEDVAAWLSDQGLSFDDLVDELQLSESEIAVVANRRLVG